MLERRSLLVFVLAWAVGACGNVGRNGFYEPIPKRQCNVVTDESARESLTRAIAAFADSQGFNLVIEPHRSAPSAPSIFWVLERFEGMIIFQSKIVGNEPDPSNPEWILDRHSHTEFSAMFYRSIMGYSDEHLERLVGEFRAALSTVEGLLTFEEQFRR
jgi:hypothetical protein